MYVAPTSLTSSTGRPYNRLPLVYIEKSFRDSFVNPKLGVTTFSEEERLPRLLDTHLATA